MMSEDYFLAMKEDLIATYAEDLCEDSLEDIRSAKDVGEFVEILNKYTAFLAYKEIPKVDWVRKWFADYKELAEEYGCYIDCERMVVNPPHPITLYGTANVSLVVSTPTIVQATAQDESRLEITTFGVCSVNVRQKNASEVDIMHKSDLAIIKIRKV